AAPAGGWGPVGPGKTAYAPDQRAPLTFGFSGDVDWRWKPYPLLHGLNREPLDFFVFLGDLIYEWMVVDESRVAETLDDYRLRYRDNREPRPGVPGVAPLQETYGQFGHYSVFDNHELGLSLADPTAPPRPAHPPPRGAPRGRRPGGLWETGRPSSRPACGRPRNPSPCASAPGAPRHGAPFPTASTTRSSGARTRSSSSWTTARTAA